MTHLLHPFVFSHRFSGNNAARSALIASVLTVVAWGAWAQTLTDLGASAPTPGIYDIAQLSTVGNRTFPDGLNYYTDNQSTHNAGEPGQTFTTENNPSAYVLASLAIRTAGLGSDSGISTPQPYYLHIYSVSGSTATLLQTYTSANVSFNDGDWLQWNGLSLPLAANTTYAWSFGKAGTASGWEAMAVATNNYYPGGEIALISPATGAITFGASHGFDAVFDAGLVLATRPNISLISVSPSTNVLAGTSVVMTAIVSGATPLHYQWQFNSGGGYADIAGANTNSLTLNAAITNSGAYQLVLTNSYGATTSAPVFLAVTPVSIGSIAISPSADVFSGTAATFAASATGAAPLHYQWQFDSGSGYANIVGANTNTLAFIAAITNTGLYQLIVSNSYGGATSAPVSLTVNLDTNPPVVLDTFNVGETNVELDFSKTLEVASATYAANYAFSSGLAVTGASLTPDGSSVLLVTAPLAYGSNYTLFINNVRDRAVPPNTIAANTRVSFVASPRQRILLDTGWRFKLGDPIDVLTNPAETNVAYYPEIPNLAKLDSTELTGVTSEAYLETIRPDPIATHLGENVSYVQTNYDDRSWRLLKLPHDWAVELPFDSSADAGHGFKPVGPGFPQNDIGWYRRTFTLPASDAGKSLWLEFGGVYRNCLVWLNGHILGRNVSGYSSFYFDATPYVNPGGTNVLVVRVDASRFEGWFYEGAGIYRHVWLTTENPVHVVEWGTFVYTSVLSGSNATVTIQTDVTNQSNVATENGSLISTICDADGNAVASFASPMNIASGQDQVVTQTVAFAANLWSLETPYLYKLVTTVSNQNAIADIYNTPFGVRTVSIDSTNGVFINGRHVEIKGMCNHQDMTGVGSALPDRLQYYRIERLKEMGCNAYRTSHNEPTSELLDACDRLGMLVLDENRRIGTNAEPLSELSRQIRRDRNHPSVFVWSLANEEPLQGTATGAAIMQVLQNLVHSLDPSRLCTAALNSWGSGFSSVLDVNGFNYALGNQDTFHASHPTEPIIGTETSSEVGDRGIYTNDTVNGYVAAYDTNAVPWGETAETWWQYYDARRWASGGFCWTGFDYRGEPTPYGWPCINSHFGVMDTCGFPKDIFYYYQANWTLKPVLHLFPHWNWSTPGQPINVWAFGNCQSVELFVNGVSQGRQTLNVQGHVEWDNVPYEPGTLQAIGYNNGVATITNTIVTTGPPASVALIPDRDAILDDGRDVSVVKVEVLDNQGRVVPTANKLIHFTVTGGSIIGVGNGNPSSHEADKASQHSVFNGLAEVIVQSTDHPGTITLTATSTGLTSANITITESAILPPPAAPTGVAAVGGNAQVTVSWNIVPGATTYNLWRATTSGGRYTLIAGNIGGVNLGYVDTNVINLTKYYYVVTANGAYANGTSADSTEVSATPAPMVTSLTATGANGQIKLNWIGAPGASYNVKRSFVSDGPYATIASSISGTNYTDSNVVSCQSYYYVVTITNAGYESLPSTEVSAEVPGALPPPFTSADVGSAGLPGSASFCGGQFTMSGSGADIWGTNDAFQFVYTYVPVSTNCDIRARVLDVQNTSANAKAAVMIRTSLAANSSFAMADVEPSAGIEFIWRNGTGASAASTVVTGAPPAWVRLTRTNNVFTAYRSGDGSTWIQIGSQTINVAVGAYVGLAVCAHNNSALNTSLIDNFTASFLTNVPPVIRWVAPTNNQSVYRANSIVLTALATDPDGTITNVSFYNGSSLLGTAVAGYAGHFSLAWNNPAAGNYELNTVATDNSGSTNTVPAAISISVVQPPPVVLQAITRQSLNGQFSLNFQGLANQTYILQTSTNLLNWTSIQTNVTTADGLMEFTDLTTSGRTKFYRIVQRFW